MTAGVFSRRLVELRLRHPFTIARGTRSAVPTVILRYERDGTAGLGEASPLARYGESVETVGRFLDLVAALPLDPVGAQEAFLAAVDGLSDGDCSAKAAVDVALRDWKARHEGLPLRRGLGIPAGPTPRSSCTIGVDSPDVVARKVAEAKAFASLKLKMGVPGEREFVALVRGLTSQPIRIDANEGWASKEEALSNLEWLAGVGVDLVEQPLPAGKLADVAWLRARSPIPLYADEDAVRGADAHRLSEAYHGVNVKLMKCGGLAEAARLARSARSQGMSVMIGCMIESSVGIAAAAQLAPLAEVVDLDGCLLVSNDPYRGPVAGDGTVTLTDAPGHGAVEAA